MTDAMPTVDLTNCDREPIHIPGSIQPHGALLAFDNGFTTALRHSANAAALLGLAGPINGEPAEKLLGAELVHSLRNALTNAGESTRPILLFNRPMLSGDRFDIAIHRFKSTVIVEFETATDSGDMPLQTARAMIDRISRLNTVDAMLQQAARLVRAFLGYDRVMIYQFERDGAGKVRAETKRGDLESFLGQYFPASDIPQQARALYLKNTIRIISSSDYQPIRVVPQFDLSGEPLDLSFAHLRSVSPIHLEYLRNMGVGASMSISIIVDGELWGLIACHHYSPRTLPMALRVSAEMFGEFFSLHLAALRQQQRLETATTARKYLDRVLQLATQRDVGTVLRENARDFGHLIPSDGFGIYLDGEWVGYGATPAAADIPDLARFIGGLADGRVWATHALAPIFPPAEQYYEQVSGVLAIPLSQYPRDYLLFFRKELVQTLNWGGDPNKSYETGPMGDRLTPRKSFAIWKETVHRQAQPWTEAEREIAEAARASLVEVVLRNHEMLQDERARAEVRQRMLNEELNHRVKNILAVIKSLVGQPLREGRNLSDYVASLQGRIAALSFAHDQVVRGEGGGQLRELLAAELGPYTTHANRVRLDGPGIAVDARAFSVLALVLHELATNAAKYGALSVANGHLDVAWKVESGGDATILWRESGGPPVSPPSRTGFGTALVDRSIPYDLGGESDVRYAPGGVEARFRIPARHVAAGPAATTAPSMVRPLATPAAAPPNATRILIVEDQMLIALDAESMLAGRGYTEITTAATLDEAFRQVRTNPPDVAILDVNLGNATSLPLAEELARLGVPYIFATGYGETDVLPDTERSRPVVRKPYTADALVNALAKVLKG